MVCYNDTRHKMEYLILRNERFIETNKRNPSHHRIEARDMLNWLKATRKKMNAREFKESKLSQFKEIIALSENYRRINQYE